jgi:two-component system, OmpR family, response regulator
MKFPSDPALGGASPASASPGAALPARRWLLAGGPPDALERMALALSRFGIDAQPWPGAPDAARHRPVLCDARQRGEVQPWIDDLPRRSAPLLLVGLSSAGARARSIAAGAADALSARIAPHELAARLEAAERLHAAQLGLVRLAGFDFDIGLRQVRWQGRVLPLMPREFDLLLMLARQAGGPISRDELLRAVWRTPFDPGTNSVEVHICKLRRSLGILRGGVWIETVRHRGYRLVSGAAPRGASDRGG